jgi:tetratricopeptide (TPR) repeat protein
MRLLTIAATLACTVYAAAVPGFARMAIPDVQRASGFCKSAERAMRAGNIKKAREALDKAIEVMPNFPGAHMGLGHVALMERRFEDALREYREARADYAQVQGAMFNLKVRDYADAQIEIVQLNDDLRNQAKLSPNVFRQNKLENAILRLQRMDIPTRQSLEEPPGQIDFYIGNALYHLGRRDEAVASWEECLRKDKQIAPAYQNLAVGYWEQRRYVDARRTLAEAEKRGLRTSQDLKADLERSAAMSALPLER